MVFFISMLLSFYFFTISTHELSNIRGVMCICFATIFIIFKLCVELYKTYSKSPTRSKFISDMLTQNEICDAYVQRSLPLRLMQYYQNGVVPSLIFSAYNGLFESSYQYFGFAIMNLSFMFIFSLIVLFFGFRPANYFEEEIVKPGPFHRRRFHSSTKRGTPLETGPDNVFVLKDTPPPENKITIHKHYHKVKVKSMKPTKGAGASAFGNIAFQCGIIACGYVMYQCNEALSGDPHRTRNTMSFLRIPFQEAHNGVSYEGKGVYYYKKCLNSDDHQQCLEKFTKFKSSGDICSKNTGLLHEELDMVDKIDFDKVDLVKSSKKSGGLTYEEIREKKKHDISTNLWLIKEGHLGPGGAINNILYDAFNNKKK